ncbi:MAG: hypothetical protein IT380_07645, partial [Myxococcales bacterium]|nr:hypothetical protein [Myxococcales bacterium]
MGSLVACGLLCMVWAKRSRRAPWPSRATMAVMLVHMSVIGLLQSPPTCLGLIATLTFGAASEFAMRRAHLVLAPRLVEVLRPPRTTGT